MCHLVHKHTKNETVLRQIQKDLQFNMIDELLNHYLSLEKAYICNAFAKGLKQEQTNMITLCEKETQIEKKVLDGAIDGNAA